MNEEYQDKFLKISEEKNDALLAMTTYLRRHKILLDKLLKHDLPPSILEELGEFLIDWGKCLTKFGELGKQEAHLFLEMLDE